jgi:hypothetical protein
LANIDRPFDPQKSGEKIFAKLKWHQKQEKELLECTAKKCAFTFPLDMRPLLVMPTTLSSRKIAYYQVMKQAALTKKKHTKRWRIKTSQITPIAQCAKASAFDTMINKPRRPSDRMVWRRLPSRPRMSPTVLVMQVNHWKQGETLCLGRSLVRADHYHNDHLELTEITPAGDGKLRVHYHVRSRFGFFSRSWLARRMKSLIRKKIKKGSRKLIKRWVKRCTK